MSGIRIIVVGALVFACGCSPAPAPNDAGAAASPNAGGQAARAATATHGSNASRAADTTRALGEFEPLAAADVDLYLKVMRTASERLKSLSGADRAALKMFHDMTSGQNPGQMPSAEQMAAMQRAGELLSLDTSVAREMGVAIRYASISSRVPKYGTPPMTGEGDDEPMTAEQRAALKVRIERFRQRRNLDAATLEPHRPEIEALQKQVDLITHPESIPR